MRANLLDALARGLVEINKITGGASGKTDIDGEVFTSGTFAARVVSIFNAPYTAALQTLKIHVKKLNIAMEDILYSVTKLIAKIGGLIGFNAFHYTQLSSLR